MVEWLIIAAVVVGVVVPFVLVPELLERAGQDPRSARSRLIVWLTFLTIILTPAALSGFLSSLNAVDVVLLAAAIAVGAAFDYFRLNPGRVPWARR